MRFEDDQQTIATYAVMTAIVAALPRPITVCTESRSRSSMIDDAGNGRVVLGSASIVVAEALGRVVQWMWTPRRGFPFP